VGGAVSGAVHDAVRGAVRDAVRDAVDGAVHGAVDDAVDDAVSGAVRGAVGGAVGGAVDGAVHGAVRDAVHGAVDGAVGGAVRGDGATIRHQWINRFGGSWWCGWSAWREFFREVCHLALPGDLWERYQSYLAANAAGWWWPHRQFVMVCDTPAAIHREQVAPRGWGSHRLHRADGPAIQYRDGWGLYFWHGVHVPAHVVEQPERITLAEIRAETHAERKRVLRERYGEDRYLAAVGARLIHADVERARKGAARRELLEDDEGRRFLRGSDGSTGRVYVMEVPPEVTTCAQAHAARSGFDEGRILNKS